MPKKTVKIRRGPHQHKQFFSMQKVRVSNTSGHAVIIEANTPTTVPEPLWVDAVRAGAMEFNPKLILAAANAVKAHVAAQSAPAAAAPRALGPTKKAAGEDVVRAAVRHVLENPTAGALTQNGVPKLSAVRQRIAEVGGTSQGLTSDAIYGIFVELQDAPAEQAVEPSRYADVDPQVDEGDLEDADGIDEPVGRGLAALQDGADAGGDDDQDE